MKKGLILLLTAITALAVVFSAGCLTQSSSVPITPDPVVTETPVIVETPAAIETPAPLTVQDASGVWYGKYNPDTTRFAKLTVGEDGKCDAVFSKISSTGNREDIDIRKGTLSLKDDGTWVLALYNDREQSTYNLFMSADRQALAETAANGLFFFRDRALSGIPANVFV
jgi:hypothetical protein